MNPYILLAKRAVETYVNEGKVINIPSDLLKELSNKKAGTFVTIEKELRGLPRSQAKLVLRGCIGTYLPTKENIAQEIIANAIAAATEDERFGRVRKEELPELSYAVYILSTPELVKDIKRLNPKKFGIIIKTFPIETPQRTDVVFNGHMAYKSGLLLPDLEGVDTVEKQLQIACQKGGINPARDSIFIYRFTVEKYERKD